jgi:hypothetical protein
MEHCTESAILDKPNIDWDLTGQDCGSTERQIDWLAKTQWKLVG